MSVKEFSTSFYDANISMQSLFKTKDDLFNQLEQDLQLVKHNQFVSTADEPTISAWERLFTIKHAEGETLQFRRDRIINRLTNKPPFNMEFLINKINSLFGDGAYTAFYNNLTITLEGEPETAERLKEIFITIMEVKPANIAYVYNAVSPILKSCPLEVYGWLGDQVSELSLAPSNTISRGDNP